MLGVSGYDSRLPDPSRDGTLAHAARAAAVEAQVESIAAAELAADERIDAAVLRELAWELRTGLEDGLWSANASGAGYASPQAMVFQAVPAAPLNDAGAVRGYLERLSGLASYFDALLRRYQESSAAGLPSTANGIRQAVGQLERHRERQLDEDALAAPLQRSPAARSQDRERALLLLEQEVRPAMARLSAGLQQLLPRARPDDRVGLRFLPGGDLLYQRSIRRCTGTQLTPTEIHEIGLEALEELGREWEQIGTRVFGRIGFPALRDRLRADPALRCRSEAQIVGIVSEALGRAERARDSYFPELEIADCVVEQIDPVEAHTAAMAYYRGPSEDGSRPGAHCVLTVDPRSRFVFEYEALAFHESSPGHHLQIASAQRLTHLPRYRRYLDAEVCGYVEGWGLYSERLADEMGLYTSDLQRLGMLSFDALRACRLVVDTGMHHLGWSREQAVDFMWANTATTRSNVSNEVDRYIAWPGQALAYMLGRRVIRQLRAEAQRRLGEAFDLRGFHGAVLSQGAVPLGVLDQVIEAWTATSRPS